MYKKTTFSILSIIALAAGILATTPVLAATNDASEAGNRQGRGQMRERKDGIRGSIVTINGSVLTVSDHQGLGVTTPAITYTVDATNAKVTKNGTVIGLSALAVGDIINVEGAISGSNITATLIHSGFGNRPEEKGLNGRGNKFSSTTTPIQGNGQPIIAGDVSAVNGTILTVTTKSGIQYSVEATAAKIVKGPVTIAISGINVGDPVIVQGVTNGTSISATSVIDQARPVVSGTPNGDTAKPGKYLGVFGQFGSFFKKIFGF